MRRKLFYMLAVLAALWAVSAVSSGAAEPVDGGAFGAEGDNLTWTLDDEGTLTVGGTGEFGTAGSPWYSVVDSIRTVRIGEGVTSLGSNAFRYCSGVTEISIPSTVTAIGGYAFGNCTSLESLAIPEGVTSIGDGLFYGCSALKEVTIPNSVSGVPYWSKIAKRNTDFLGCPEDLVVRCCGRSYGQYLAEVNGVAWDSAGLGDSQVEEITVATQAEWEDVLKQYFYDSPERRAGVYPSHLRIVLEDGCYTMNMLPVTQLLDVSIAARHPGKVELLSGNSGYPVVRIYQSAFVTLDGVIIGHRVEASAGSSSGGCGGGSSLNNDWNAHVVSLNDAGWVKILGCDLWGCGICGIRLGGCGEIEVRDSILRDCVYCAVSTCGTVGDVSFDNCIISGNDYRDKRQYPCVALGASVSRLTGNDGQDYVVEVVPHVQFNGCVFFNNHNTEKVTAEYSGTCEFNNCACYHNAWDGETPQNYGVCLGGVTWQVEDGELYLGRDIDGVMQSGQGDVPDYSAAACPWKRARTTMSEGSLYGRDGTSVSYEYDMRKGTVKVTGKVSAGEPVFVAVYNDLGQMLSADRIDAAGGTADIDGAAAAVRLLWVKEDLSPKARAADVDLLN